MQRILALALSILLLALSAPATRAQGSVEPETDRPGGDFARLLNIQSAEACQQACTREKRCAAWTYAQGPRDCWLKEQQQSPVYKANNISGVVRGSGNPPPPPNARLDQPLFTNTEPSCAEYGQWITDLMKKGQRAGCDFADVSDWFDPQKHVRWCMRQSASRMQNAVTISTGHLKSRCARVGIDYRTIR